MLLDKYCPKEKFAHFLHNMAKFMTSLELTRLLCEEDCHSRCPKSVAMNGQQCF